LQIQERLQKTCGEVKPAGRGGLIAMSTLLGYPYIDHGEITMMKMRPIAAAIACVALFGSAAAFAQSGYDGPRKDSSYGKDRDDRSYYGEDRAKRYAYGKGDDRPGKRYAYGKARKDDYRPRNDDYRAKKNDQRQEHLYARDYGTGKYGKEDYRKYGNEDYRRDGRRYEGGASYDRQAKYERNADDYRDRNYPRKDAYSRNDDRPNYGASSLHRRDDYGRAQGDDHRTYRREDRRNDDYYRPERIEKAAKVERPEKVVRVERVERPEKVEKVERVERPEKAERVERPEKVEKVEKVERPEKPEHGGSGRH
jgi:hypothetical protein